MPGSVIVVLIHDSLSSWVRNSHSASNLLGGNKSRDIQEVHQGKLTEKKVHRSMEIRVQPN